jgi:hypothetical protein
MMNDSKPWYYSRTIWASAVTVAAAIAGLFGPAIGDAEAAELTDAILRAMTAAGGLVAIVGRIAARNRIG